MRKTNLLFAAFAAIILLSCGSTGQMEKSAEESKITVQESIRQEKTTAIQSDAFLKSESSIFFLKKHDDGSEVMAEAYRDFPESSLRQAMGALLEGLNPTEKRAGLFSLIPDGTRLLGAGISNGVATLDFSEEFTNKFFGVDVIIAQLMQVVYTATEFDGVKSVQILIDGKKEDYIGGEGVWIGSPLSRNSF